MAFYWLTNMVGVVSWLLTLDLLFRVTFLQSLPGEANHHVSPRFGEYFSIFVQPPKKKEQI